MAAPTLLVEFSFTKSGNSYVWNNISSYVRSVSIDRGISRELEDYSAGSAKVVLSNKTRYFDPTYASSPYAGQIVPAGAIRITSGGVVIFYGFIDNWTFDYPENNFDSTATVTAYDSLSLLAKMSISNDGTSYYPETTTGERISQILGRSEVSWNPTLKSIDGGTNYISAGDVVGGTDVLAYIQDVARAEPGDVFSAADGSITFRDRRWLDFSYNLPTYRYNLCNCPSFESGTSAYWVRGTVTSAKSYYGSKSLQGFYESAANTTYVIYTDTDATKWASGKAGIGTYYISLWVYPTTTTINFTTIFSLSGATVSSSTTAPVVTANTWQRIGMNIFAPSFDTCQIQIDSGLGSNTFYVDGIMIEKTSTMLGYFDGNVIDFTGTTTRYTSYWDLATNLSTSTLSIQTINNSASFTTINLSDYSAANIPVTEIQTIYGGENLYNRISLTNVGGTNQLAQDTNLQATYGVRTYSNEALLNRDSSAVTSMAYELLTQYAQPEYRAEQVSIAVHSLSAANQSTILNGDIRDAVKLTFTPSRTGSSMMKYYSIIGISHEIANKMHTTTFKIASLSNQPFRLNSAVTGVLDVNVLAYG